MTSRIATILNTLAKQLSTARNSKTPHAHRSSRGLGSAEDRRKERRKFSKWGTGLSTLGSKSNVTVGEPEVESGENFNLDQYPGRQRRNESRNQAKVEVNLGPFIQVHGRQALQIMELDLGGERDNISGCDGSEDGILPLMTRTELLAGCEISQNQTSRARRDNSRVDRLNLHGRGGIDSYSLESGIAVTRDGRQY
jgi:hypothetical protein